MLPYLMLYIHIRHQTSPHQHCTPLQSALYRPENLSVPVWEKPINQIARYLGIVVFSVRWYQIWVGPFLIYWLSVLVIDETLVLFCEILRSHQGWSGAGQSPAILCTKYHRFYSDFRRIFSYPASYPAHLRNIFNFLFIVKSLSKVTETNDTEFSSKVF